MAANDADVREVSLVEEGGDFGIGQARAIGPRKLVLINSAVYDEGEVPLDSAVHLAGNNNVGKTTLINALQFFYLDASNRRFPKKMGEAIRFYFKQNGYLMLEVETPTGIKVILAYGEPKKAGGIQYMVFEGAYEKALFCDENHNVRDQESILANLAATRSGRFLDPVQLRNAITGSGDSGGVRLDIIPTSKYPAFTRVFRHLISLRATKDSDLKEMILDSSQDIKTENWVLDLPRICGEEYASAKAESARVARLKGALPIWERLRGHQAQVETIMGRLPLEWTLLTDHALLREKEAQAHLRDLEAQREEGAEEERGLRQRKDTCDAARSSLQDSRGAAAGDLKSLQDMQGRLDAMEPEAMLLAKKEGLDQDLTEMEVELRLASEGASQQQGKRQIEERIHSAEQQLARECKRLEDPSMETWGNRILSEYQQEEREKLQKLFNRDLLSLPEGEGGIEIRNETALHDFLSEVVAAGGPRALESKSFSIDLTGLAAPNLDIKDPLSIQQSIERLEASIDRDRALLKGVSDLEGKRKERDRVQREREIAERDLAAIYHFREELAKLPATKVLADDLEIKLQAAREAYRAADDELEAFRERWRVLERDLEIADKNLRSLRSGAIRNLDLLGENLALERVEILDGAALSQCGFEEALQAFGGNANKVNDLRGRIREDLGIVAEQLGGIDGATEEARFAAVARDMDALTGLEDKLAKQWEMMVTHAGRGFYDLDKDLERVRARVEAINRRLSKVRVSNLRGITIHMEEDNISMKPIRDWLSASQIPLIEGEKLERSRRVLATYLDQNRQFELEGLFKLRVDVRRADGSEESYSSLETESTGTGITIKVVLLSMLLRDHLRGRDNVVLPLFVDEVDSLDDSNRRAILTCAKDMGFRVLMASPHVVPAERVLFLHSIRGKTVIRERESLILRFPVRPKVVAAMVADTEPAGEAGPDA